ncbi:hypothetical protein BH11ARM1_BH11ARM1_04560 [soil metagenome]
MDNRTRTGLLRVVTIDSYTATKIDAALDDILSDLDKIAEGAKYDGWRNIDQLSRRDLSEMKRLDDAIDQTRAITDRFALNRKANEPQYGENRSYGEPLAMIGPSAEYSRPVYADDEDHGERMLGMVLVTLVVVSGIAFAWLMGGR